MRPAQRQPAFSLLELIIVVAIMAVLAGMAIPRFSNATVRYRADAAAQRVVADLTLARELASHSSSSQTVTFDVTGDSYQIAGLTDPDHPADNYQVRLAEDPYGTTIVSADFDGAPEIVFNGFGLPVGIEGTAGTVVIQVGSEVRTVVLDGTIGEMAILNIAWVPGDPLDPNDIVGGEAGLPLFVE